MLGDGAVAVDDDHLPLAAQRRPQPPEEGIGLLDLMIHMHHHNPVEAVGGQLGIVGTAELDRDIVEPLAAHAQAQPVDRFGHDVLRQHAAAFPDALGQTDSVIAVARADIGDAHAILDAGAVHHIVGFAKTVARVLVRPAGRDCGRDGAVGAGEFGGAARAVGGGEHVTG